ncbi:MAG TPA: flagellar hook capping FlgD N-terminal domain-containing protein [Azospirillum sp.]|nr:flagellar hook capping FlgD N-terminal domain-containing protein [Azospirillum sp.]
MTTTTTAGSMNWDISQTQKQNTTKTADKADVKTSESDTSVAIKGLGDNFSTFLKLLTTQMQNQDPTKPMDTNEMTQQLVQFANIEQNIGTNTRLDKLLKMQQAAAASSNLGYLGKTVSFEGDTFTLANDTTDTPLSYELETAAKTVEVKILGADGKTVIRTLKGDPAAGKHQVVWDYKDDDGQIVQPGTYKLSVAATAEDEETVIVAKTSVFGRVDGVGSQDGETTLTVNGRDIPLSRIASVH